MRSARQIMMDEALREEIYHFDAVDFLEGEAEDDSIFEEVASTSG